MTFRIANYPVFPNPRENAGELEEVLRPMFGKCTRALDISVLHDKAGTRVYAQNRVAADDLIKAIKEQLGPKYQWHESEWG